MSRELIIFDRPTKKSVSSKKGVQPLDEEEASVSLQPATSLTKVSGAGSKTSLATKVASSKSSIAKSIAKSVPKKTPVPSKKVSSQPKISPVPTVFQRELSGEEDLHEEGIPQEPTQRVPAAPPQLVSRPKDRIAIPDLLNPLPDRMPEPNSENQRGMNSLVGKQKKSWLPFGGSTSSAKTSSSRIEEDLDVQAGSVDTEALYARGLATIKDLIAPPAIRVTANVMQIGDVMSRTLFVIAYPRFLSTNWFSPIVNIDFAMDTALFVHPIDTADILKTLRKQATQVQSQMNIEIEDGKIRDPVLEAALQNIEELRDRLQQGTEKFFRFGLYITLYGSDEKDLNAKTQSIEAILEAQLVYTKPAVLRMDKGFAATRPLGSDVLDVANNLNTEPLSTTFPFVSSDLSSNEGILYGINRHNNSLILFDRFKMENANMVVFAKSGAGKSYTVKLEVLRSLMFGTDVIIIDPENEYKHLCETVGGSFIPISLSSSIHLNPFDLPKTKEGDDREGVFRNAIANLVGLLHLMLGTLTPEEDSILDQALRETYAVRDIHAGTDFSKLVPSSYPTMSDLYAILRNMEGAESLATRLERYTEGIFSGFLNHQTNIETENQLTVFNIRDLEEELRPIAMYMVLQHIWNEIRSTLKRRIIVVDEAWLMMQNEDAAAFLFGIAKRCRKYFTGLTTITQDISDFMSSRYGKPIVTNSSMQLLLRQSPASIEYVAETFYLTDHEKFLLLESNVGEGIFFAGTKHAAIKVIASYSEDQIITSDPRQLLEIEEAKREFDASNP